MILKVYQIMNAIPALRELSQKRFSARIALSIARLINALQPEIDIAQNEQKRIIGQFAKYDENGKPMSDENGILIEPTHLKEYDAQMKELINSEIEISCKPLNIEWLDGTEFSAADIAALEPFLEMNE